MVLLDQSISGFLLLLKQLQLLLLTRGQATCSCPGVKQLLLKPRPAFSKVWHCKLVTVIAKHILNGNYSRMNWYLLGIIEYVE